MAILYPRALPTHTGIRNITLRAVNVTAVSESVFTLRQQIYKHTGERWEAEITLPAMARASAEQWVAWLLSMRGREGTFLLGDPVGKTPRGSAGGTPVVNGAGQTGDSISIDGCTASQTGWLKAGDYIQLGSGASASLHKVLQDVNSSGAGQATLDVWPSIRNAPADNATVVVSTPIGAQGVFRLSTSSTEWSINEIAHFGVVFPAVQAIA
tara:strand:+ start:2835 stop:3467 length:633 start_codon:yes stop_codon:yes gene_type:complete